GQCHGRIRQCHQTTGGGKYFSGRHAAEKLRCHTPRPRRVLRLRRIVSVNPLQFPPHTGAANRRRRNGERPLVHGGAQRCVPGRIPPVLFRQPARSRRLRKSTPGYLPPGILDRHATPDQRRRCPRCVSVSQETAVCCAWGYADLGAAKISWPLQAACGGQPYTFGLILAIAKESNPILSFRAASGYSERLIM